MRDQTSDRFALVSILLIVGIILALGFSDEALPSSPPGVAPAPPPADIPSPRGTVTSYWLNVRASPWVEENGDNRIGALQQGEQVIILGRDDSGDWLFIVFGGSGGWVSAAYIQTDVAINSLPVHR